MLRIITFLVGLGLCTATNAETPFVAADIAPVHSLVARVMDGAGLPDLIVPQSASPHGYAMRPSQAEALQRSKLVVWMGPGLSPWLHDSLDTLAKDAQHLNLLDVAGTNILPWREGHGFDDDDHDHDHDHDHDAEGADPHAWLDPLNAAVWLDAIAEALSALDPENAELYRANASAGQAEFSVLTEEIMAQMSEYKGLGFVVSHDALHYFEARFDVHASGAVAAGDAAAPGAARLAELRHIMEDHNITCILLELGSDPARYSAIFGPQQRFAEVDLLGQRQPLGAGLYPAVIRGIAQSITACSQP